jgi:hypothetical protein
VCQKTNAEPPRLDGTPQHPTAAPVKSVRRTVGRRPISAGLQSGALTKTAGNFIPPPATPSGVPRRIAAARHPVGRPTAHCGGPASRPAPHGGIAAARHSVRCLTADCGGPASRPVPHGGLRRPGIPSGASRRIAAARHPVRRPTAESPRPATPSGAPRRIAAARHSVRCLTADCRGPASRPVPHGGLRRPAIPSGALTKTAGDFTHIIHEHAGANRRAQPARDEHE